jgi:ATP-dependent helicase/nuclease subunit B
MTNLVTQVFDTIKQSPVLYIFWKEKLRSEALQFVDFEIDRRKNLVPILYEHKGRFSFATSKGGTFTLTARCDRIDKDKNGQVILVDYKTSSASAPSYEQMKAGFAPQLPLQAIMVSEGGFGKPYTVAGAEYIIINKAIETKAMKPKEKMSDDPVFCELMGDIFKQFQAWVDLFNDDNTGYISRRLPEFLKFTGDYDLLARVPEWNISDDESTEQEGD